MAPVGETTFAVLVWSAIALVAAVFAYEVVIVLRELRENRRKDQA